jgi:hypothetical protein
VPVTGRIRLLWILFVIQKTVPWVTRLPRNHANPRPRYPIRCVPDSVAVRCCAQARNPQQAGTKKRRRSGGAFEYPLTSAAQNRGVRYQYVDLSFTKSFFAMRPWMPRVLSTTCVTWKSTAALLSV